MDIHEQREPLSRQRMVRLCLILTILLALSGFHADRLEGGVNSADTPPATGRVIDESTHLPLPEATVTLNYAEVVFTDRNGLFPIDSHLDHVGARAPGYTRAEITVNAESSTPPIELHLQPIRPKALYLTVYGIHSGLIREKALELIEQTELNALVIDMKGDRGFLPYDSQIPLAIAIGAQKLRLVKDVRGLIRSLIAEVSS